MAYCSKCGGKLEKDDVYCPSCGTKRIDLDDCINKESGTSQNINMNINIKYGADVFINMFLNPIITAKKFINNGKKDTTIILTIFVIIMHGILGMWRIGQVISSLNSITLKYLKKMVEFVNLLNIGDSYNSISGDEISQATAEISKIKSIIKIPYGNIFLQNCVLILLSILIIFIIICLVNSLLSNNKPHIFKFYKAALISTVPVLYFKFFSIIVSYLSINFGILLLLFGFIVSLICVAIVINKSLMIPERYIPFVVSFIALIVFIVLLICLQKFILSNISTIMSSIMNNIKNLDL